MKDRQTFEEAVDKVEQGLAADLVMLPVHVRGMTLASFVMQKLTLEVLLDIRDLLKQVETSTDRLDVRVEEINERASRQSP